MLDRRFIMLASGLLAAFGTLSTAHAVEKHPYTPQAFEAAQAAGKSILVEITAPWCPTCKAQKPILSKLTADPKFRGLEVLDVDFDSQKAAVRALGAQMQSTLIAFKGTKEVGRSVGDTRPASIESLLDKSI